MQRVEAEAGPPSARGPTLASVTLATTGVTVLLFAALEGAPLARETSQLASDLAQVVFCVVAAYGCGAAASRAWGLPRWFWALNGSFAALWAVGQISWTIDAQGLVPASVLAPSDFLFLASSAPLLLALVVRPYEPREEALGLVFDAGLVAVFAFHTYIYFSLGYLIGGPSHGYHEWVNALGNLDSILVLLGFFWACRVARGPWRRTYQRLALVMVALHGGSSVSSFTVIAGSYHPGFLDLPWVLPFLWLAILGFSWRPKEGIEESVSIPSPDFGDTRRGLVLAILVVVAVPSLDFVMELATNPLPVLSRTRHLLTLSTAVVLGALFLARQLALLRRTEGLHLAREENLKRLFESNPLPQFLCLKNGLRVVEVNRAAELAYGYSREELLGMSFAELHPKGQASRLESCIEAAARPGEDGRLAGDWKHRTREGAVRVIELTARALDLGPRDSFLVVAADVTEHRHLEERMLHAQKMEALGRLAGGVAHDFNNLLTAILGYCSLLGLKMREPTCASFVREIERSGERAAALTKQLLAFSRKQVLVPQVLDLGTVVRELELMLRPIVGEDVELLLDIAEGENEYRVKADRGQIEQVILNLAVNARDAMPGGGTVEIEVYRQDSQIVLAVNDTGTGMDDATRSRVFEPFFTTKPPGKGTGLGLATVYGIVTQSGGSVSIESRIGEGSRVLVSLPRCRESGIADAPADEPMALPGSATILLVEDDDSVRGMTGRILEQQGYRVLTASSGADALELASRHDGLDLVVTDVVMPAMKGPELVGQLLELSPGIKVLYVSGYAADSLGLGGILDQDTPFLAKPFTAASLARRVREVLDKVPVSGR